VVKGNTYLTDMEYQNHPNPTNRSAHKKFPKLLWYICSVLALSATNSWYPTVRSQAVAYTVPNTAIFTRPRAEILRQQIVHPLPRRISKIKNVVSLESCSSLPMNRNGRYPIPSELYQM